MRPRQHTLLAFSTAENRVDCAEASLVLNLQVLDTGSLFGFPQDSRQGVAEIHGTDFLTLCGADLRFLPYGVIPHTPADGEALFLQVDVLPSQPAHLADTKPSEIGDLDRQ